jgi:hypothetical protein
MFQVYLEGTFFISEIDYTLGYFADATEVT